MKYRLHRIPGQRGTIRAQKGFSLIELMIVVAIILIIAAIAIPSLTGAKVSANEASAVASIHVIGTAQTQYSTTYPQIGFASKLTQLGPAPDGNPNSDAANLVAGDLTTKGAKSGYKFTLTGGGAVYTIIATPEMPGKTGRRSFCSDQSSVIYYSDSDTGCAIGTNPLQ
jgi:type IV pilus assembly protein PilA